MRCITLMILLATVSWAADPQPPALRVGDAVRPNRYHLDLTLDPAKPDFSGQLEIGLQFRQSVPLFWLNATGLTVTEASVNTGGVEHTARIVPGGEDFVGFQFAQPLPIGQAQMKLRYQGKVNQQASAGIFLNKYKNAQYLFTQFEPLDARRALPCFDEPGFKVPWQLTLHVPAGQLAVANTPVEQELNESAGKVYRFAETKPLPSYLVAFGVGPFEFVDAGRAGKNRVPVRIVVPQGDREQAQYAASVTAEILTRLENYFGIPYPYPKADQLAIPISFGGAMENPGLVTYDSSIILAKPGQDSPNRQRSYAMTAAHELAHQWFGDLVTMAWWNDTWLKEAFATWMENKLVSAWKPEWKNQVEEQGMRLSAMRVDSLISARRINQSAESKSDINNAFDGITYRKGGAVIGMFESSMGVGKFQQCVRSYLQQHAFSNARTEDFLAALSKAGGPEIAPAFQTFLNQAGVPELSVALQCPAQGAPVLQMEQRRSLPVGSAGSTAQTWAVPVCVAYANGSGRTRQCTMLKTQKGTMTLTGAKSCPAWVLPNASEVGYYRVKYQGDLLGRLLGPNRQQLTLVEQVGLLGDVIALANSGSIQASEALALVPQIKDDPNREIVSAALDIIKAFSGALIPDDLRPNRARMVRGLFGERARALGWVPQAGESEDARILRSELVPYVASIGEDADLIAQAKGLAQKWLTDRSVVPSDVAGSILQASAWFSTDRGWYDTLLATAKKEQDPRQKRQLLSALAAFRQPELVRESLQLVLGDTFDLRQASTLLFGSGDRAAREMIAAFVKQNYDAIIAKQPSSAGSDFGVMLPGIVATGACSEEQRTEIETFFRPRMAKVTGGPRALDQTLEGIHLCAARKAVQQASVAEFLQRY